GYFHLRGRIVTSKIEHGERWPFGFDEYNTGRLYTDLSINCQGDERSRESEHDAVYGIDIDYRGVFSIDATKAKIMTKTLERIERCLEKLRLSRGYVQSYGEYVGRIAEIIGAEGIVVHQKQPFERNRPEQYHWDNIGNGVNLINRVIWRW